jgi:hypothetical protein
MRRQAALSLYLPVWHMNPSNHPKLFPMFGSSRFESRVVSLLELNYLIYQAAAPWLHSLLVSV